MDAHGPFTLWRYLIVLVVFGLITGLHGRLGR